jgi:hypothetical protein
MAVNSPYPQAVFWEDATQNPSNPGSTPAGPQTGANGVIVSGQNWATVPYSNGLVYGLGSGAAAPPNQPPSWNIPQAAPTAPQSEEFEFLERPGLRRLSSRARFTSVPPAKNTEETRPAGPGGGTLLGGRSRPELSATQQFYLAAKGLLE